MRFYGQFNPPLDKCLFERYFQQKRSGFFVEAGAHDGLEECTCKFFEESMGWSGINVEPAPFTFARLVKNRPLSRNANVALSDKEGVAKLKVVIRPDRGENLGYSSLCHSQEYLKALEQEGCSFRDIDVRTTTYDALVREGGAPRVDLFVLDVEGHELGVIRGMNNPLPKVLCIEHGFVKENQLREALVPRGFHFDCFMHNNMIFTRDPS